VRWNDVRAPFLTPDALGPAHSVTDSGPPVPTVRTVPGRAELPASESPTLPRFREDAGSPRQAISAVLPSSRPLGALGRVLLRFLGADGAVSNTQGSLLHPALVDAPSVQPVSVLTARFRGRRSCGIWFGGLGGQFHGRQDFPDGVLGLDQGNEAQRALAARTRDVNLERSSEQLAP
jgi:hypothetical protein